ncbi:MAG TPA: hypothetical protein VKT72_18240 [Candidatus Baltobacteraceae bacterium]|nr:hypothetical protein [Candidatus Baltobacteraceae bacterium]
MQRSTVGTSVVLSVGGMDVPPAERASVESYSQCARARTTIRNYQSHLELAAALAQRWERCALPMDSGTACAMIAALADAGYEYGTIRNFVSALRFAHRITAHPDPTQTLPFRLVYEGIMRTLGTGSPHRKAALLREDLHCLLEQAQPHTVKATQQCAMLALGFFGAFRCSEERDIDIEHLHPGDNGGVRIYLPRSKTDRFGRGEWVYLTPFEADPLICPVRNLKRQLALVGERSGPLFRRLRGQHAITNARVEIKWLDTQLKSLARRAGMPVAELGTHSLRAGWATQAVFDGLSEIEIAAHLRHHDLHTLPVYYRPGHRGLNLRDFLFRDEQDAR